MNKKGSCTMYMIAKILLIIGGINWGLVGLGMLLGSESWNVVNMIFSFSSEVEAIVYLLVGISGVVYIFGCNCEKCAEGVCAPNEASMGSKV